MSKFLETEKQRLIKFKAISPYFSNTARVDGIYKGKPRSFCIPRACAEENLLSDVRETAMAYFGKHEIKWHDGQNGKPSNHLCSSQVCCVNFLYPFVDKPAALAELLHPLFSGIRRMLPIESEGQFIAFEWIGQDNYLGEKTPRHSKRTRGANFTSADAAVMFERQDGARQIVLIEWKYTESYSSTSLKISRSGTDRTAIYAHLYHRDDFPLNKRLLPGFDALFYEPFYQLMRQQLLAHEMEKAHELGAEIVTLLHIAPAHNQDFQRVTSLELSDLDETVVGIWRKLQKYQNRFESISTEDMFNRFPVDKYPQLTSWWQYIITRYTWLQE